MRLHTVKRIAARDRRRVAIHEAGHIVMGRHVGIDTFRAEIFPTYAQHTYDKLWIGKATYLRHSNTRAMRMFAVAGAVAEDVWQGGEFYDEDWYDHDAMSATDWAGAGCEPGKPLRIVLLAIERTYGLFDPSGELWPKVLWEARRLIEESRDHLKSPEYIASLSP